MLKWTVQNQRANGTLDNIDTLSNVSSGSDSSDSINPGRSTQRSYLKKVTGSKAMPPHLDALFYSKSHNNNLPESAHNRAQLYLDSRDKSSSLENGYDEGAYRKGRSIQRHASTCCDQNTDAKTNQCSSSTDSGVLKISTSDSGVLKISLKNPKDKQRSGFWRNLKAKAQGKGKDGKLSRSSSMRSTHEDDFQEPTTPDEAPALPITELIDTSERPVEKTSALSRPRSFKLIRRQSQNKKPRPFNKQLSISVDNDDSSELGTMSPDSGVSSIRQPSTDSEAEESPGSPNSVMSHDFSKDISQLRRQFTDAVLHYLHDRNDSQTSSANDSICSRTSEVSESGASDIFCYDTDTVLRRPNQNAAVIRN